MLKFSFFSLSPQLTPFVVLGTSVIDKYVGESERKIEMLFGILAKLREKGLRTVAYVDEVDCLLGQRGDSGSSALTGAKSTLISMLEGGDGQKKDLYFIATCNKTWQLDHAYRSRATELFVNLPSIYDLSALLRHLLKEPIEELIKWNVSQQDIMKIAKFMKARLFSARDVVNAVRDAQTACHARLMRQKYFRRSEGVMIPCSRLHPRAVPVGRVMMMSSRNEYILLAKVEATKKDLMTAANKVKTATTQLKLNVYERVHADGDLIETGEMLVKRHF